MDSDVNVNYTPPWGNGTLTNISLEISNTTWTKYDYFWEEVAAALNVYYTPLLIFFGCLGNLVSLFVFYTSKIRLQSTSVYLSALAISDTLFLIQLIPPWLDSIHYSSLFATSGFCQGTVYFSYVSCCLSTWIVVAFTVERFVAVLYPLQRSIICTVTRAKYVVLVISILAFLLNAPVLKFAAPAKDACSIDADFIQHAARFNLVDTMVSFTVPLAAIIILNCRIIVGVFQLERARQQLLKVECRPGPSSRITTPPALRPQHRVTRMLLIVSSVFVVLNLPAYTMRVLAYTYDMAVVDEVAGYLMSSSVDEVRWAALQQLALTFFHTNFGINFMLYCLSGQNFRRALCNAIPWLRRFSPDAAMTRRAMFHPARASSISTSFASAGPEATNNVQLSTVTMENIGPVRRHRSDPVIKRWKFDNSRQRAAHDEATVEMETFNIGAGTEHSI